MRISPGNIDINSGAAFDVRATLGDCRSGPSAARGVELVTTASNELETLDDDDTVSWLDGRPTVRSMQEGVRSDAGGSWLLSSSLSGTVTGRSSVASPLDVSRVSTSAGSDTE
jgi:hypothetical protein